MAVSSVAKKASFVEVAVAPITSSPHRMHVAYDEKMSMWLDSVINMLTRSVRTISTCSFVEMSFFALSHVPPVLLMGRGKLDAGHKDAGRQKPAQETFPNLNLAIREPKITNALVSFKEDFMGDQHALGIIKLCTAIGDAMEVIGAQS